MLYQTRYIWLTLFFLCLVSLPRLTHLGGYVIVDEADRWRWAEDFTNALRQGDLKATLIGDGYPGIVPVWAETVWIFAEATRRSWEVGAWIGEAGYSDLMHQWERQDSLHLQRFPIVILNILLTLIIIALTWRLLGWHIGFLAGVLIALDPFYLSDSRVNRAEAVITGLMTLSILWLIHYAKSQKRRDLILSAIFCGLSLLTKIQALVILPAIGLILWLIISQRHIITKPRDILQPQILGQLAQQLAIWLLIVALTWVILWPAMWVIPAETLTLVYNYATRKAGATGVNLFFWGQTYEDSDPGLLFYPFVMLMRLTPLASIGLLGFIYFCRRVIYPERKTLFQLRHYNNEIAQTSLYLFIYITIYAVAMSSGSHKQDRYLLPIFPALNILAGIGLAYLWQRIGYHASNIITFSIVALLFLSIPIATIYPHHPYYYSYFNPLLGGGATAVKTLRVGWGEGMDQVGEYLAAKPNGRDLVVSTRFTHNMPAFKGKLISLLPDGRWTQADYIVLYIQQVQRQQEPSPEFLAYFEARQPEKVITIAGIDYAKIYPIPFSVAANPQLSHITGQLALLGYRWENDRPTLRLWWENQGLTADRSLMVRLVGTAATTAWATCQPDTPFREIASHNGAYIESLCSLDVSLLPEAIYTLEVGLSQSTQEVEILVFPGGWQAVTLDKHKKISDTPRREQLKAIIDQKLPPQTPRLQRIYNQQLHLVGYDLTPHQPRRGDTVEMTLYWQRVNEMLRPINLTVQLADSRHLPLGRDDTLLPVESGLPYTIMPTHHRFKLADDLSVPLAAQIEVTLHNQAEVALNATNFEGQSLDSTITRLTIWPSSIVTPSYISTQAIWQDNLELLGYHLTSPRAGQKWQVTLFWQARQPITTNYMVFVHLLDSSGQIISQHDSLPREGAYPTLWWQPHLLIADDHTLTLPAELPPGPYQLAIGLYDAASSVRLPLTDRTDHVKLGINN